MSVTFNPIAHYVCVHGKSENGTSCVCDAGWTTSTNQNPLLGPLVYCNQTSHVIPPGKGTVSPLFVVLLVLAVFLNIVLVALTIFRYLWVKKKKVKLGPLSPTQSYNIARLTGYLHALQRIELDDMEPRSHEDPSSSSYNSFSAQIRK